MKLNQENNRFFQEKYVPADCSLAGLAALVQALNVPAPVRQPSCISAHRLKQSVKQTDEWRIFDSKYALEPTVEAHLGFAMKHENVDLLVLKRIFLALPESFIKEFITATPTGAISRRIWFLYEFVTGTELDIPDCGKVTTVDVLDRQQYFTTGGTVSTRHKVRNNLLGTVEFCPIVRRTEKLEKMVGLDLSARAKEILARVSPQLVARAASFLLLADSQASFAIEGERLPINKEERWLRAVQQVGRHPLTIDELNRLHEILISDPRFTGSGFRTDGVFLGNHTYDGRPLPEFIGARPDDIQRLIAGVIASNIIMQHADVDAVIQAASVAFGFIYIHPYTDGNGRLHRCLIHHVLTEKKFSPPGIVFPVSSVMLNWIDQYRQTLQNHSKALMPYINWFATDSGNVDVTNDTADLYRFFDCTAECEFLYDCVKETIEHDVPQEIEYLKRHDEAITAMTSRIDMPNRMAESFLMFMRRNDWKLPKRRREREFAALSDAEVEQLEAIINDAFDGYEADSNKTLL